MNTDKEYLTQTKFDEFKKELEYLKSTKRTEIAKQLEYAKSLGDLSENAEYHEARNTQAIVEDRINHLESLLKSAQIVSAHDTSTANVGSVVTVERTGDKSRKTYTLVGSEETDAVKGLISVRSPLGLAVRGKSKGEVFSFNAPSGAVTYKVIDIK
ncbi:transcription elongation factor GreA [Candidatus Parcubacteria bacterium]|nr:transcription elongation factor GreA [Candidatus Parcubacteria bacterium]